MLHDTGASVSSVDLKLLDRYFDDYIARGVIPAAPRRVSTVSDDFALFVMYAALGAGLSARLGRPVRVTSLELESSSRDESIIAELTGWRSGTRTGLMRGRVSYVDQRGGPGAIDVLALEQTAR